MNPTPATESTKEQHDAKASHGAMHGADTLSRYFSSPQPMALSKEVRGVGGAVGGVGGPRLGC